MDLTYFLAHVFGFYLLIIAFLFFFKQKEFIRAVGEMAKSEGLLLLGGLFGTTCGLLVVLSHSVWDAGTLATLVSLMGWAILIKGLVVIFLPQQTIKAWTNWSNMDKLAYFYGLATLLLGLYLVFA